MSERHSPTPKRSSIVPSNRAATNPERKQRGHYETSFGIFGQGKGNSLPAWGWKHIAVVGLNEQMDKLRTAIRDTRNSELSIPTLATATLAKLI
jgi:hypothetical protein